MRHASCILTCYFTSELKKRNLNSILPFGHTSGDSQILLGYACLSKLLHHLLWLISRWLSWGLPLGKCTWELVGYSTWHAQPGGSFQPLTSGISEVFWVPAGLIKWKERHVWLDIYLSWYYFPVCFSSSIWSRAWCTVSSSWQTSTNCSNEVCSSHWERTFDKNSGYL